MIRIHRPAVTEDTQVFKNQSDAARYLGVTRNLISRCLNKRYQNIKAKGYVIEIISNENKENNE